MFLCLRAGKEHSFVPSCSGGTAQADSLLDNFHDLGTQAPQVPAPTLWQAEGDL